MDSELNEYGHLRHCVGVEFFILDRTRCIFKKVIKVQHRELISLLLHPHLQHALDSPTTTSRPFLSALRRASSTSSVIGERAERLNPAASDATSKAGFFHVWDSARSCSLIS